MVVEESITRYSVTYHPRCTSNFTWRLIVSLPARHTVLIQKLFLRAKWLRIVSIMWSLILKVHSKSRSECTVDCEIMIRFLLWCKIWPWNSESLFFFYFFCFFSNWQDPASLSMLVTSRTCSSSFCMCQQCLMSHEHWSHCPHPPSNKSNPLLFSSMTSPSRPHALAFGLPSNKLASPVYNRFGIILKAMASHLEMEALLYSIL